jgi:hypothetical protein
MKITFEETSEHYKTISEFEISNKFSIDIETGLSSIFLLSQNFPIRETSDFFSGENFPLSECSEELEISYHLIKYGFYKQSMISLRTSLEIGLLSIYWSIIGKESNEFKEWISSKLNTPFQNKDFWKTIKSNLNIEKFDSKFHLIDEIKKVGLSDFVHTKGIRHSNFGKVQRTLKNPDEFKDFKDWLGKFKKIVRILEILHLLKFPTLNLRFSTDFLLSKFGTFNNIPQFGGGLGNEMEVISSFIPDNQKLFIYELTDSDDEVKYIKKWLNALPNLTEKEIKAKILKEQKQNIEMSSFNNWYENFGLYDHRITSELITELKEWSVVNGLMTLEDIFNSHKKKANI